MNMETIRNHVNIHSYSYKYSKIIKIIKGRQCKRRGTCRASNVIWQHQELISYQINKQNDLVNMGLSKGSAKRERKQRKSGKAVKRRKRGNKRSKRRKRICRDLGRDLDRDLGHCLLRVSCEIYCFCNQSHPCTHKIISFTWSFDFYFYFTRHMTFP